MFNVARNSCEQVLENIVTDSAVARYRRQEGVQSVVEATKSNGGLQRISTKFSSNTSSSGDSSSSTAREGYYRYIRNIFTKQNIPRILLVLGLTVLFIRILYNITKIREMLRSVVFHTLVTILFFIILYFLYHIFSDYFVTENIRDKTENSMDTMTNYSTIVTNTSSNKSIESVSNNKHQYNSVSSLPPHIISTTAATTTGSNKGRKID